MPRLFLLVALLALSACGTFHPAHGPHGGARCMPSCDLPMRGR